MKVGPDIYVQATALDIYVQATALGIYVQATRSVIAGSFSSHVGALTPIKYVGFIIQVYSWLPFATTPVMSTSLPTGARCGDTKSNLLSSHQFAIIDAFECGLTAGIDTGAPSAFAHSPAKAVVHLRL